MYTKGANNPSAHFRTRENSTCRETLHRDHAWVSRLQQTSTPRPRPTQAGKGRIRDDDGVRSDTAIKESMGITMQSLLQVIP